MVEIIIIAKEEIKIDYSSITIQHSVAALSEAKFLSKSSIVNNLKEGDTIEIVMRYKHPSFFKVNRTVKFLEANNPNDIVKEIIKQLKEKKEVYIDKPRLLFKGEVFNKSISNDAASGQTVISCLCDQSYYKRNRISLFNTEVSKNALRKMNDYLFRGYPVLYTSLTETLKAIFGNDADGGDTIISSIRDMLNRLKMFAEKDKDKNWEKDVDGFSFWSDKLDGNILKSFSDNNLNEFFALPFNSAGNKVRLALQGKLTELLKSAGKTENPEIFSLWKVLLDSFGYDMIFFNKKRDTTLESQLVQTLIKNNKKIEAEDLGVSFEKAEKNKCGAFLIKPLYDDFSPKISNIIFPSEVFSGNKFENFYREITRAYIKVFNTEDTSNQVVPKTGIFFQVKSKPGERLELIHFDYPSSKKNSISAVDDSNTTANIKDELRVEKKNIEEKAKIAISELEKKKGSIPIERDFIISDFRKIVPSDFYKEGVDGKVLGDAESKLGLGLLALQTVYDGVYGERNMSFSLDFNPTLIPGITSVVNYFDDYSDDMKICYGKTNSIVHSISPTQFSTSMQMSRVISEKEEMISVYETTKTKNDDKYVFDSYARYTDLLDGGNILGETKLSDTKNFLFNIEKGKGIKTISGEKLLKYGKEVLEKIPEEDLKAMKYATLPEWTKGKGREEELWKL